MKTTLLIPDLKTSEVLNFAKNINQKKLSVYDAIFFDAQQLNWAEPFGLLLAACSIKQLRSQYPKTPFKIASFPDHLPNGLSYAVQMGFFNAISDKLHIGKAVGELTGNDNYIPITELNFKKVAHEEFFLNTVCDIESAIEARANTLAKILCRNNLQMVKLLTYLLREILRNIHEHAMTENSLVCGQYWPQIGEAEIAIVDEGIGLKSSLQKNLFHKPNITNDQDALEYALKAGISCTFSPDQSLKNYDTWQNSGFGLYMVHQISRYLKGSFCIASGNRFLKEEYKNKVYARICGDTRFNGTAIKIRFSEELLRNSDAIIKDIYQAGEIESQYIENAFRKASNPSKGLIHK